MSEDKWASYHVCAARLGANDVTEGASVERFVQAKLGALLEYDAQKNSNLVETLFHYLESGGNYAGASGALIVHRSTLKYRLQRIGEISGHDLSDPDTSFNLQLAIRVRPWARNRQTRPAHDRKVFDCVASGRVCYQRVRFGTGRRECLEAGEWMAGHSVNKDSVNAARSISVGISIDAKVPH